ncbi:MAG: CDF family Co(II)/Ni(II) efflux transporter DmeF [Candidatus Omnitrophica bacterium]|nr:CDF family Co(II)/Ni(II) efflux transporter DmeF [Candidatus Omnitrophota bacterium]
MHYENLHLWQHDHTFGQEQKRKGERRTAIVIAVTGTMMVIEIITGFIFGSMALLADGLHMASHATALIINLYAYIYARRHAYDTRYSFGTGKVNALGGFTGAVLLAVFALMMVWGSIERIIHPVSIAFNQAILVAVIGLIVNGASVFILGHEGGHNHEHEHHDHDDHDHDHNLKSAYYHVLADALTSILAIGALLAAKYFGLIWMDPVMGIVGAILVCRWAIGLLRTTSAVLLDKEEADEFREIVKKSIEKENDNRVTDLHIWAIGPNIYSVILSVVTHNPRPPEYYKSLLPCGRGLKHVTVEVHQCDNE